MIGELSLDPPFCSNSHSHHWNSTPTPNPNRKSYSRYWGGHPPGALGLVLSQPVGWVFHGFLPRGCCGASHELLNLFISRLRLLLFDQFHLRVMWRPRVGTCGQHQQCTTRRSRESDVVGLHNKPYPSISHFNHFQSS